MKTRKIKEQQDEDETQTLGQDDSTAEHGDHAVYEYERVGEETAPVLQTKKTKH